jgi:putative chitinase
MITTAAEAKEALQQLIGWIDRSVEAATPIPVTHVPVIPTASVGLQNPGAFYNYIRGEEGELFPVMSQAQFDGIEETLRQAAGVLPLGWCAYVLSTEYHETAKRMQAVREGLNLSDAWRKKNLKYYPWYGRGEVQLTHKYNYELATKQLRDRGWNVDLVADPDQALRPDVSTAVMIFGMIEGWFTGKQLRDYINNNPTREQYRNARRIVNGTDRADLLAGYALEFEKALNLGDWK